MCLIKFLKKVYYSVLPIYRGRVYCGIGYIWRSHVGPHFLAAHFTNFTDMAPKSVIFREIAVIPWTPYVGDSFSRNLLTAVAFDPAPRRQFFAKSALGQSGLPVKCGREHMLCDGQPRKTPPLYHRVGYYLSGVYVNPCHRPLIRARLTHF